MTTASISDLPGCKACNGTAAQTGAAVTVTNASCNGTVAAGGKASFGFLGSWHAADSTPSAFTLNGVACGNVS